MATSQPILRLTDVSKAFGGVQALKQVSLTANAGEIHAVIGENGAGKSTLMKIIAGALAPDSGAMALSGAPVSLQGPKDAAERGIAIVYQEPTYFAELSVLENFYIGAELRNRYGILRWNAMAKEAARALEQMELPATLLTRRMSELSIGTQQLVLIAKGIHKQATLLILDEPTSILSRQETQTLFATLDHLRGRGVAVLYISHRIQELFDISDTITVLRDGADVARLKTIDATEEQLVRAMTGRVLDDATRRSRSFRSEQPMLRVDHLGTTGYFSNAGLELYQGQIMGVYGLVGSGRTEMATAIVGAMQRDSGAVYLDDKPFTPSGLRAAIDSGVVYLPEDRNTQGLFAIRSLRDNLTAGVLRTLSGTLGIIDRRKEAHAANREIATLQIKAHSPTSRVSSLSGGNQQKVLLGRGLLQTPRVLILDEPTRGIDVGTKREIHRLIGELASNGLAILLISSDLIEVLAVADTILVMREGRIVGTFGRQEATEERVIKLALALGGKG